MQCENCGLLESAGEEQAYCVRFEKDLASLQSANASDWRCPYFMKILLEDGERLPPRQHLFIQNADFRGKKMRGPI